MNAIVQAVPEPIETVPSSGSPTEPAHDKEGSDGVDYASLFGGLAEAIDGKEEEGAGETNSLLEANNDVGDDDTEVDFGHPIIPAPAEPVAPVATAVPEPVVPATPTPAVEPTQPVVQPTVTEPVVTTPVEGSGRTFAEVEADLAASRERTMLAITKARENRQQQIDSLAVNHYAKLIPQETWDEVQTSPQTALPKLLAMNYVDAVQGVTSNLLQSLPGVIQMVIQSNNLAQMAEDEMFKTFPMLKDKRFYDDINAYGKAYGKEKPNATLEEKVRYIGTAVCMKHQIAPPTIRQPEPQQPVVQQRSRQPSPVLNSSTAFGLPPVSGNPFEVLSQSMIEED